MKLKMKALRNGSLYKDTVKNELVRVRNHNLNTSSVVVTPPHADAPLQAIKLKDLSLASRDEVDEYLEEAGELKPKRARALPPLPKPTVPVPISKKEKLLFLSQASV